MLHRPPSTAPVKVAYGKQSATWKSAVAPVRWALHASHAAAANLAAVVPAVAVPRTHTVGPAKPTPCQAHASAPALYWVRLHEWLLPVHPSARVPAVGT